MALGIDFNNVDKSSFLGLIRDTVIYAPALDTNYFSAATDGGAQATIDISAAVAGTALNRSVSGKRPLMWGRRPTITSVDASGTNLSITVRLVGRRFGRQVTQDITATGAGGGETVEGTKIIDEMVSMTVVAISNKAASDTVAVGFDGKWIGLRAPFRSYKDIRLVMKNAGGTPDVDGAKYSASITSAMCKPQEGGFDLNALYSAVIAVTHIYDIEYEAAGAGVFSFDRKGLRFN